MIPLTIRWAKRIGVPKQQLLMPLSYATILGGTCTLVGTSTNLVVSGLLTKNYPNEPSGNIGLFDLAIYGVPNAMIGLAYMLAFAPFLLPYGQSKTTSDTDDLLLGATVMPWSPAAGRTIKRSGLGNSGGIFLTNVRRAATGNVHRAVSSDFVISIGDELYFTGSVENFADFCDQHGLEIITNDTHLPKGDADATTAAEGNGDAASEGDAKYGTNGDGGGGDDDMALKYPSKGSDDALERLRQIRHLSDQISGHDVVEPGPRPVQLLVALDETEQTVLVGVDCEDHPGLLMHISDGIGQQGYNLKHSEAKVIGDRSLSVWRCEAPHTAIANGTTLPDLDELWSNIYAVLKAADRDLVAKKSGARVVRAYVTKASSLIGKKPVDVDFRETYKASIVAYQKKGKNYMLDVELSAGDLLVLHTAEESPLLAKPPADFYETLEKLKRSGANKAPEADDDIEISLDGYRQAWSDLKVVFDENSHDAALPKGEFLTAFVVPPNSSLQNKSLNALGYNKLSGVALIGVERPNGAHGALAISPDEALQEGDLVWYSGSAEAIADLQRLQGLVFYRDDEMKAQTVALTERRLVQAVIAKGSPLVGRTVKELHFRSEYGGVVIAIQRGSDRVHELPANVQLKTGDVLLVEASRTFVDKHSGNYRTFALLSEVENSSPPRPRLFLVCVVLIIASLAVAAVQLRSLLITASLVGVIMVSLGIVTQQEARDALQWDLFITVASAFGIGNAMNNSGVAGGLATFLVRVGQGLGIGGTSRSSAVLVHASWSCLTCIVVQSPASTAPCTSPATS
jgi:di/tricarboxylate transporter